MYISYEIIGQRIKNARKKMGFTQAKLAQKIGISISQISKIESGIVKIKIQEIASFSNILNIPIKDLLASHEIYSDDKSIGDIRNMHISELLHDCNEDEARLLLKIMLAIKNIMKAHQ